MRFIPKISDSRPELNVMRNEPELDFHEKVEVLTKGAEILIEKSKFVEAAADLLNAHGSWENIPLKEVELVVKKTKESYEPEMVIAVARVLQESKGIKKQLH